MARRVRGLDRRASRRSSRTRSSSSIIRWRVSNWVTGGYIVRSSRSRR